MHPGVYFQVHKIDLDRRTIDMESKVFMPNITDVARLFNDRENETLKQSLVEKDVILKGLVWNTYLRAVLSLVEQHKSMGYKGVDVIHYWTERFMNGEWNEPAECHKVIPYLQALGYDVVEFDDPLECPFSVDWSCGKPTQEDLCKYERNGWRYFPAQDFQSLKAAGNFKDCRMSDGVYIEYLVRRTIDMESKVLMSSITCVGQYTTDFSASVHSLPTSLHHRVGKECTAANIFNDRENATLRQSIVEKDVILEELVSNAYLRAVLSLIDHHKSMGYCGVDVFHNQTEKFMGGKLYWIVRTEISKVIPYLQALGYGVTDFNGTEDCPFNVDWTFKYDLLERDSATREYNGWRYFPPQDFQSLKAAGAFKDCRMCDDAYFVCYDSDDDSDDDSDNDW